MFFNMKKLLGKSSALLMPLLLAACATSSPPPPPEIARSIQLTPLPASVKRIGMKPSEEWLAKVSSYLLKVEAYSNNETAK